MIRRPSLLTRHRRPSSVLAVALVLIAACGDDAPRDASPAPKDAASNDAPSPADTPVIAPADVSDDVSLDTASDAVFLDDPSPVPGDEGWHIVHEALPEALLSVWGRGSEDLWAVGADKGVGPIVLHGTSAGWTRVVTGTTGDLWWVFGPDDTQVVMVGQGGTVLRYAPDSDTLTSLDTGTDATLFGVWGTPERLWAVGGHLPPADGPPVLLRIEGEDVTQVPLPPGLPDGVIFFKVWGTSPGDVWVIGEQGVQLHFDGVSWTYHPVADSPRLVTLHGDGGGLRVAVGGAGNAVLLEDLGMGWEDRTPPLSPALNGVFVGADRAAAVGMLGSAHLRSGGLWTSAPSLPLFVDLHAVWLDDRADVYTVGGGLLSVTAMDRGALLRWGPPRDDVPSGAITTHHPVQAPVAADISSPLEDASPGEDIGPMMDAEVSHAPDILPVDVGFDSAEDVVMDLDAGLDVAMEVHGSGDVSWDAGGVADATSDVQDGAVGDVGEDVVDVAVDASVDAVTDITDSVGDVSEVSEVEAGPVDVEELPEASDSAAGTVDILAPAALAVTLGEVTPALDFSVLEAGQNLEIVQGPQGGVHVEVGVRVSLAPELGTMLASIDAVSLIGGEAVGSMVLDDYGLYETAEGYVSWAIPVIFFTNLADPYVGETLEIAITVTLESGEQGTGTASVHLVDWY